MERPMDDEAGGAELDPAREGFVDALYDALAEAVSRGILTAT